jgi:hypothetical protein
MQIRRKHRAHILIAVGMTTFSLLACEPFIAIGWKEIFFIFVLGAILLGPPLYRFARWMEAFLKHQKKNQ